MLIEKGWCLIDYGNSDEELIYLAKALGEIALDNSDVIHILRPKEKKSGIKDSFSYKYGLEQFPYHTDTAFWSIPTKYFILASERESKCSTYLIDFSQLIGSVSQSELKIFQKSVFILKTPSQTKFVSLLSNNDSKLNLRYDPNIMSAFNKYAKDAVGILDDFLNKSKPIEVEWTGSNVLVVDNWRMLHSRGECIDEKERTLKRIYVN